MEKNNESLKEVLLELLKDFNLKQAEIDDSNRKIQDLETEIELYKKMYEDYKEAADDRWNRLQFYEQNKLAKLLCSFNIRVKKKEIIEENFCGKEQYKEGNFGIYSKEEKEHFKECVDRVKNLNYKPLISLVIPVYNTDLLLLDELYQSLKLQIYSNWEVCFANGSKNNGELHQQLVKYAKEDKRVQYQVLEKNGGISYNTNQAFEMAKGEFIGMVDHDDLLTPDALAEVVFALNKNSRLDFIYSDQDKVDEKTTSRFGILYKPAWSMEMLYSGNYITHFSVVRKSIINEIGGWESATDGAQDWDLFLKIAEKTKNIYAIPRILYHWRTAPTSTAASMDNKNYAAEAQIKSLQNHLERMNYDAIASFSNPKNLEIHIEWKVNKNNNISVIVYDEKLNEDLDDYIWQIQLQIGAQLEQVIVLSDDQKRLDSIKRECKKICLSNESNYAKAYNIGKEMAQGKILLFMTDRILPVSLKTYFELESWAAHPEIGLVGPKIIYKNKKINSLGIAINKQKPVSILHGYSDNSGILTEFGTTSWYRNVNAMDYHCFAIEKKKYKEIGGFDENRKELAMLDFCLRARRLYRNLINPFAIVQYNEDYAEYIDEKCKREYNQIFNEYNMPNVDMYYNVELLK